MPTVERARALLETGSLCDACLGRRFAERSHGLTNAERGRALRIAAALADDVPFAPADPGDCWVCGTASTTFDSWAERAAGATAGLEFDTYVVGTRPPPTVEENERALVEKLGPPDDGEPFKSECNREVGKRLGGLTGATADRLHADVAVLLDMSSGDVDVQVNPAFVYGRYWKLEPGISQTTLACRTCGGRGERWVEGEARSCPACGGTGLVAPRSVEGFVSPAVTEALEGTGAVFHGAGREDADTLVLDRGRPFVVEVKEPRKRTFDAAMVETAVHEAADGAVEVMDLAPATREMVDRVKQLPFRHSYRLSFAAGAPVDPGRFADALRSLDGATVHQRERPAEPGKAGSERLRELRDIRGELADAAAGTVEFSVEAGIDVAEVVTGGDGRTEPSLAALLGTSIEVTEAVIVDVEGTDEPFAVPDAFRPNPREP